MSFSHARCGAALVGLITALGGCAAPPSRPAPAAVSAPMPVAPAAPAYEDAGPAVVGAASWYQRSAVLQRTCTGQQLHNNALTAASPSLPMGTLVRVTVLSSNRSVVVLINDCMPHERRVIDLSEDAARQLGLVAMGVSRVSVTPVKLVHG